MIRAALLTFLLLCGPALACAPQSCIDTRQPIPSGEYVLSAPLVLRTGTSITGVTFKAHRDLIAPQGMIVAHHPTTRITLQDVVLDGNLAERRGAWFCNGVDHYNGVLLHLDNVSDVVLDGVVARNAPCGAGVVINASRARIVGSTFSNNGVHEIDYHWADGLTALRLDDSVVLGNLFENNSDVSLAFSGQRTLIARNTFIQRSRIFAAVGFTGFHGSRSGDMAGTVLTNNTLLCTGCNYGISLDAWGSSVSGLTLTANTVHGAKVPILLADASQITLQHNSLTGFTGGDFSCGALPAAPIIAVRSSVVSDQPVRVLEQGVCPR